MRNKRYEKFLIVFIAFFGLFLFIFNYSAAEAYYGVEDTPVYEDKYCVLQPLFVEETTSVSENILNISEEDLISNQDLFVVEQDVLKLDYDSEQLKYLAAAIYCESSAKGSLEDMSAVGWVIYNRLADPVWHYSSIKEAVMADGQFTVTQRSDWDYIVDNILTMHTERSMTAVTAAMMIMLGEDVYSLPEDVQFFCAGETETFGGHTFYATIGGNSFFKR